MSPSGRRHRAARPTVQVSALLSAVALSLGGIAPDASAGTTPPAPSRSSAVPSVPAPRIPASTIGGPSLARPGIVVDVPAGVPVIPAPQAGGWLLADLDTGNVLAASQAHARLAPASTLKVFTALAVSPTLEKDRVYVARAADAAIDGSKVGLVAGSRYTVDDLMHGLMLGSGNDCANALATLVGGTGPATALMNTTAQRLGAFDTVALTPSGLDAPGQVSSAYDLALAGRAALANPRLAAVLAATRYRFPAAGTALGPARERFEIQNHNKLLRNYAGATGGKTGYTVAARHAYIGSAERGDKRYVVTMLRTEGSTWRQAAKLLDWAFAHGTVARRVGALVEPGTVTPFPSAVASTGAAAADGDANADSAVGTAGEEDGVAGAARDASAAAAGSSGIGPLSQVSAASERLLDRAGLPVGRWSWAVLAAGALVVVAGGVLLRARSRAAAGYRRR